MSLPADCGECRVCGQPIWYSKTFCANCELLRDEKGRFVKRPSDAWYRGYDDGTGPVDLDDDDDGVTP